MKKSLLLLLFLTLSIGVAWAQKKQITVKGIVLSVEDKEPIVPVRGVERSVHNDTSAQYPLNR